MSLKKHLLSASGVRKIKGNLLHSIPNPDPYLFSSAYNYFGKAVATTNNYAIIGAEGNQNEDGTEPDYGRAYIFDVKTGTLLHTLYSPDAEYQSDFGVAVDITDNYCVVGQTKLDSSASDAGRAHVYNTKTGDFLYSVDAVFTYQSGQSQNFGSKVAISDNHLIVATDAFSEDASNNAAGRAFIYEVTTGNLLHTLENPSFTGTAAYDRFGSSVGICDKYAIVAARLEDTDGTNSGVAYIYDPASGSLLHFLTNPNAYSTADNDAFGFDAKICDEYAIVSASGEEHSDGGVGSGIAYIFNPKTGELLHTLENPTPSNLSSSNQFAHLGISKKYSIVSAPFEDDTYTGSGVAYIFDNSTGSLLHTITNPNATGTTASDNFGRGVSISDDYAVIGALGEEVGTVTNAGYAYIYG